MTNLDIKKGDEVQLDNSKYMNSTGAREKLVIANSELEKIPEQFVTVFPNLYSVSLTICNISELNGDFLKVLSNISSLFFTKVNLNVIKDFTFQDLKVLQHLHIRHCELSSIEENSFVGMNSLRALHIHGSELTYIKKNTFKTLKSLETLEITKTQLKVLDLNLNSNLMNLDLSSNKICFVRFDLFENLKRLENLNLLHNSCVSKSTGHFDKNFVERLTICFRNISCLMDCDSVQQNDKYKLDRVLYCKIFNEKSKMFENANETLIEEFEGLQKNISGYSDILEGEIKSHHEIDAILNKILNDLHGNYSEINKNVAVLQENIAGNFKNGNSNDLEEKFGKNLTNFRNELMRDSNQRFEILFVIVGILFILLSILFALILYLNFKPINKIYYY